MNSSGEFDAAFAATIAAAAFAIAVREEKLAAQRENSRSITEPKSGYRRTTRASRGRWSFGGEVFGASAAAASAPPPCRTPPHGAPR
jgi:hypothetical protein